MIDFKIRKIIKNLEKEAKKINPDKTKSLIRYYKKNKFSNAKQFHIEMLKKIIKGEIKNG